MVINADASAGKLRLQIEDVQRGEVIPGLSFDDCQPVRADGLRLPVCWGNMELTTKKLKSLSGRTIRFRFELSGAKLFTLDLLELGM
jgi:hypothetical protein